MIDITIVHIAVIRITIVRIAIIRITIVRISVIRITIVCISVICASIVGLRFSACIVDRRSLLRQYHRSVIQADRRRPVEHRSIRIKNRHLTIIHNIADIAS